MESLGGLYVGLVLFGIAVAIAWLFVPFAIMGTKPILRDIRKALEENNRLLREQQARQ